MTVVRLSNGNLWVHSPIQPSPELSRSLEAIGPVAFVVAPNKSHHLYFASFVQAHPAAKGFIAPGLAGKRPELAGFNQLNEPQYWLPDIQGYFIDGLPVINETVWFHPSTGTLLISDLVFCFGPENSWLTLLVARLLGVRERLAMSRTMRLMVQDKSALRLSVEPLLSLPIERIVVGHDAIITESPAAKLKKAFAWLE